MATQSFEQRRTYFESLYRQTSDPWSHSVFRRALGNFGLADVVLQVAPHASILDIGCGTGDFTALLCDLGFDTFGVDCSQHAIIHARNRWPAVGHRFVQRISECEPIREQIAVVLRDVDYYNDAAFIEIILRKVSVIGLPVTLIVGRSAKTAWSHPAPREPAGFRPYVLNKLSRQLFRMCDLLVWGWTVR